MFIGGMVTIPSHGCKNGIVLTTSMFFFGHWRMALWRDLFHQLAQSNPQIRQVPEKKSVPKAQSFDFSSPQQGHPNWRFP